MVMVARGIRTRPGITVNNYRVMGGDVLAEFEELQGNVHMSLKHHMIAVRGGEDVLYQRLKNITRMDTLRNMIMQKHCSATNHTWMRLTNSALYNNVPSNILERKKFNSSQ